MPTIQVTGLAVVAIFVTDFDRAKEFYEEQLGFAVCGDYPPGILLEAGEITIYLEGARNARRSDPHKDVDVRSVFLTRSVRETHEKLKTAGVPIVQEYQEFSATYAIFQIKDPDGNVIEFAGKP